MISLDIKSYGDYPSNQLSNFYPHTFIFKGVPCASMEGLLQSFKYEDYYKQLEVCNMTGKLAKRIGTKRNKVWQKKQTLWWRFHSFTRDSDIYQNLLNQAYFDLWSQNEEFRNALATTGDLTLTHRMGSKDTKKSILTEDEFCSRLTNLRNMRL